MNPRSRSLSQEDFDLVVSGMVTVSSEGDKCAL
jgi:hypothetical protein